MAELKKGDAVEWTASQGAIKGKVEKKLTAPIDIKGHHVAASPENPEYLVVGGPGRGVGLRHFAGFSEPGLCAASAPVRSLFTRYCGSSGDAVT